MHFSFLGVAALAVANTNLAAASSMIIWIILDIIVGKTRGHNVGMVSIPGACSAIVVGLVVITPGAGYVQPGYALLMGLIGGAGVFLFLLGKKHYFRVDDTLDVFSCHGIGGFIGTMLTGVFCQTDVNSGISNGAIYGQPIQLWYQFAGVLVTCSFSAACTAAILLPMHFIIGIRIDRVDQVRGLDNVAHGVIEQEQSHQQGKPAFIRQKQIVQAWP
jgi:Amt family ammonium transporter